MINWISVEDRLPEPEVGILLRRQPECDEMFSVFSGYFVEHDENIGEHFVNFQGHICMHITHWAELNDVEVVE